MRPILLTRWAFLALVSVAAPLAAQSQREMNESADRSYRRADSTLNAVYAKVVARYRSDSLSLQKLRKAQRAWITFRDAQLEAVFPGNPDQYGSVQSMCVAILLEQMTKDRIAQLRLMLGEEEGDVCQGGPA